MELEGGQLDNVCSSVGSAQPYKNWRKGLRDNKLGGRLLIALPPRCLQGKKKIGSVSPVSAGERIVEGGYCQRLAAVQHSQIRKAVEGVFGQLAVFPQLL